MTAYWLIESEEAKAKWDELMDKAEKKRKTLSTWIARVGGDDGFLIGHDGEIMGIRFGSDPGKGWKEDRRSNGYYTPKRNTKAGKLLSDEMHQQRGGMGRTTVGKTFLGHAMVFSDLKMLSCGWETTNKGVILKANEGTEKEQWKPIDGLRRLKDSEYWSIKEAQENEA